MTQLCAESLDRRLWSVSALQHRARVTSGAPDRDKTLCTRGSDPTPARLTIQTAPVQEGSFILGTFSSLLGTAACVVYTFARANIIALIPLVRGGWVGGLQGYWKSGQRGLGGVFWSLFRKRKVEGPSVPTLYENSSYLTKTGLPKADGRHVFI